MGGSPSRCCRDGEAGETEAFPVVGLLIRKVTSKPRKGREFLSHLGAEPGGMGASRLVGPEEDPGVPAKNTGHQGATERRLFPERDPEGPLLWALQSSSHWGRADQSLGRRGFFPVFQGRKPRPARASAKYASGALASSWRTPGGGGPVTQGHLRKRPLSGTASSTAGATG